LFAKCFTPLQIDGTMGVTAAVSEMLVQSHEGVIDLLPALPDEWQSGKFSGVCARGAFEISFRWENSKVREVELLSKEGRICKLDAGEVASVMLRGKNVKFKTLKDKSIEFPTGKEALYIIKVKY
jgi:alpha-L-fucosidase 2